MFCTQCGTEMQEQHLFCFHCGKPTRPGMRRKPERLARDMEDKKIAGVCSGFARYFGVDITLVRVIWLLLVVLGGTGLLAYIVCWIVMPKDNVTTAGRTEPAPVRETPA